ncbi:MAG: hypothetical protein KF901_16915 [Myxococcales bacterium]|nr:hypothetical protein [Myxococcales bacterium]
MRRARGIDIRPHEGLGADDVRAGLAREVSQVVADAVALCEALLCHYDGCPEEVGGLDDAFGEAEASASGLFYVNVDNLMNDAGQRVADVAFLGLSELRQKMSPRRVAEMSDGWDVVAECGSALRRTIKALTAIEVVLARAEGFEAKLGYESEASRSIEVRREYARLRRTIAREGAPADTEALRRAFRRVGTAIAMLIGRDVYPDLRIHDRRQLRALQARILDWLRAVDAPIAATEGGRLWQDMVGFADLLSHVNRRQELVEHDARMIRKLLEQEWTATTGIDLRSLRGLDDELDARIEERASEEVIHPILLRLAKRFQLSMPTVTPADAWSETTP